MDTLARVRVVCVCVVFVHLLMVNTLLSLSLSLSPLSLSLTLKESEGQAAWDHRSRSWLSAISAPSPLCDDDAFYLFLQKQAWAVSVKIFFKKTERVGLLVTYFLGR